MAESDNHDETHAAQARKPASKCRPAKAGNFEKVLAKLQAAAAASVATLHSSLFDGSASTRIRAASAILNLAITSEEIGDLEKRLSALEGRKWR
jgi:hypothetical protein